MKPNLHEKAALRRRVPETLAELNNERERSGAWGEKKKRAPRTKGCPTNLK
jgi:hypothetical protein